MHTKRKKAGRRVLGVLLTLAMLVGLMPGMSLTALADNQIAYTFTATSTGDSWDKWMCYLAHSQGNQDCTKITKIDALVDMENIVDGGWGQVKWQNYNNEGPAQSIEGTPGIRKYTVEHETIPDAASAIVQIVGSARLLGFVVYAGDDVLNSGGTMDIPELTVPQAITGLKESGSDQALVTAGTAAAGSIEYSLDNNTWSTDVPKAKDKGDYTVYYRLKYGYNNSQIYTSLHGAKGIPVTIDEAEQYPLWVGGTQVTSANASNIDGNNKASYDAATKTLTLNGYSYTGQGHPDSDEGYSGSIYAGSGIDLNIVLSGTNSVTIDNSPIETACAIFVSDNLTITGSGALNAHGKTHGIYSTKTITINGGSVTAESPTNGISAWNGIDITDGTVKTKGDSIGFSTPGGALRISGGEVTAEGKNHGGFVASTVSITGGKAITSGKNGILEANVIIEGGELIASGEEMGIHTYSTTDNNVRNAITGTGWSDTAGTQGKATIAISTEGQNLSRYKKVQFPAVKEPSTVTKIPEAKNLTYTGSAQALVEAGTASGGTMQYALGTKDAATGTYSASIPTGTEAGTYYVWYKVAGDANHNDSEARCVTATIAKKYEPTPATVGRVAKPSTQASPSKGAIEVSWKAATGAKSYQVQWRKAGASRWTTKTVKGRAYTITGLKRGTAYQVRVRGVSGAAKGDWSKASSRWLKAASKVRAATGKKSGTVKVSWAKDAKATGGCRVYVYARQGGKPIKTIEVAKGKAAATVKGLKPGKTYYVRVRPYRRASGTTFSGAISGYRTVRAAK